MPMMTQDHSETSVTFSLAELAKIEGERVREEDDRRARSLQREAREHHETEAKRRAAEAAHLAAQEDARARRVREEAEEKARAQAREQASLMVARIEAESKARIEAENATRAHELAVLRVNSESGRKRLQIVLAVALGLAVFGGGAAGIVANGRLSNLERDNVQLREEHSALVKERDQAKATELAALDKRFTALLTNPLARPGVRETESARETAEEARKAVDIKALDHARLRAFGEALDVLDARISGLEKLSVLDRRSSDLQVWADQRKKGDLALQAKTAALRAKGSTDDGSLRTYETALNDVGSKLGRESSASGAGAGEQKIKTGKCNDPNDPMCGFNGQSL